MELGIFLSVILVRLGRVKICPNTRAELVLYSLGNLPQQKYVIKITKRES